MRVALVKTSSMGDVVHALAVVTDIRRALPAASIDWVVEESFADLPTLHPAVERVLVVAMRRWRRAWFAAPARRERAACRATLAERRYDCVIDLQGLLKSALITRWLRGPSAGFSWSCAREPLASLAYRHRFAVDMGKHAIERLRSLAGQALGYRPLGLPVFGLRAAPLHAAGLPDEFAARLAGPYVVLLHATSRVSKQYPADRWRTVIAALAQRGLGIVLPWGSDDERRAAQRFADGSPACVLAPRMRLAQCAALLGGAHGVVGVDTGLTHLSAAIDTPTVALFAATPAWRFGPYWSERSRSLGVDGRWPGPDEVLATLDTVCAEARRVATDEPPPR